MTSKPMKGKVVVGVDIVWDPEQDVYGVRVRSLTKTSEARVAGSLSSAVEEAQEILRKFNRGCEEDEGQ